MLNTMVSLIIPIITRTARIACADRQTDRQTYKTTTVTLAAHVCRGLIKVQIREVLLYALACIVITPLKWEGGLTGIEDLGGVLILWPQTLPVRMSTDTASCSSL